MTGHESWKSGRSRILEGERTLGRMVVRWRRGRRELQPLRPTAGAVVHAHDLDRCAAHAIGDDVRRFGYDEFARSRHASCVAELGILRKQMLYAVENVQGDALCGGWIMLGDVGAQGDEVVGRFGRPYERHTPRGDGRSLVVSQEPTHCLTRSCGTPLPRSSEERAAVMPEICHSFVSRYAQRTICAKRPCLEVAVLQRASVKRWGEGTRARKISRSHGNFPPNTAFSLRPCYRHSHTTEGTNVE
jgi:hypothetical protein